jgi:hypothetical protein
MREVQCLRELSGAPKKAQLPRVSSAAGRSMRPLGTIGTPGATSMVGTLFPLRSLGGGSLRCLATTHVIRRRFGRLALRAVSAVKHLRGCSRGTTCQSTRTHNSRRRLRRSCWWSGHLYVIGRGEGSGARSCHAIAFAASRMSGIVAIHSLPLRSSGDAPGALGRVAAPAPKQVPADISGHVSSFVGLRAMVSSDRRRHGARASWRASTRKANYGHV